MFEGIRPNFWAMTTAGFGSLEFGLTSNLSRQETIVINAMKLLGPLVGPSLRNPDGILDLNKIPGEIQGGLRQLLVDQVWHQRPLHACDYDRLWSQPLFTQFLDSLWKTKNGRTLSLPIDDAERIMRRLSADMVSIDVTIFQEHYSVPAAFVVGGLFRPLSHQGTEGIGDKQIPPPLYTISKAIRLEASQEYPDIPPANMKDAFVVRVDNRVLMSNNECKEILDDLGVTQDQRNSALGVQLIPEGIIREGMCKVTLTKNATRAALVGRIDFVDSKTGTHWRYLTAKGIGALINATMIVTVIGEERISSTGDTWGVTDLEDATTDFEMSLRFIREGIRTVIPVAIIELDHILNKNSSPLTIQEAQQIGLLRKNERPVVYLRAFATHLRMSDLYLELYGYKKNSSIEKRQMVDAAMRTVEREIRQFVKRDSFGINDYANWFAYTLGQVFRKIHDMNVLHHNVSGQNITLDCRILDLDTVTEIEYPWQIEDELKDVRSTLVHFTRVINEVYSTNLESDELSEIFMRSYLTES